MDCEDSQTGIGGRTGETFESAGESHYKVWVMIERVIGSAL